KYGVQVNTVSCNKYDYEGTKTADIVISVGGDGTFLSAALRITDKNKPIIGINSNPDTSEGSLCLPRHWHNNIPLIHSSRIILLMEDNRGAVDFKSLSRHRDNKILALSSTLIPGVAFSSGSGSVTLKCVALHSYRQRIRLISSTPPSELKALDDVTPLIFEPHAPHSRHSDEATQSNSPFQSPTYLLSFRSLNDVFVSACMSARVSRYEVSIDDSEPMTQKSSGFLVCTGTGSSSWHRSLHQINANLVAKILSLASDSSVSSNDNNLSAASSYFELAALIAERYNSSLLFPPDSQYMAFSVRELIANHVFKFGSPRGFAKKMSICHSSLIHMNNLLKLIPLLRIVSRMDDAYISVDGWLALPFEDGTSLELSIHPDDVLCVADFSDTIPVLSVEFKN
ncbi:hypothetical protein ACTXT7_016321, partial [Hymenolepis weldensis]